MSWFLYFIWKYKRPWTAQAVLRKKNGAGGMTLPGFRLYYKALDIEKQTKKKKLCLLWHQDLWISELKWTEMGELNSDDHYIYYSGQEVLRRNGVALTAKTRVWNAVLGCILKNNKIIAIHFQGKSLKKVIEEYAPPTNVKVYEVDWFYDDLHYMLDRNIKTKQNKISFSYRRLECKYRIKRYLE